MLLQGIKIIKNQPIFNSSNLNKYLNREDFL